MGKTKVPFIFHFVFGLKEQTEPFHLMYYLCLRSCMNVNNPDKVFFHYYHEPYGEWWDRIKDELVLCRITPDNIISQYQYQNSSIESFRYAHLSDVSRLQILQKHGGIYADIDTLFVNPLPKELFNYPCVMGKERSPKKGQGSLCNAWIASEPNGQFCQAWLERMMDEFDGSWSNHSTLFPYRLSEELPETIHVEPMSSFFQLSWKANDINDLFLRNISLPANVYSLHLWNHLWFNPERTDFSYFNHELLTADYVAFASTTYANYARRHLSVDELALSKERYQDALARTRKRHPWVFLKTKLGLM